MLPGRDDMTLASRRHFLRWLGLAGLVAGASPVAFAASKPKPTPVPQAPATPPDTGRPRRRLPRGPRRSSPPRTRARSPGSCERRYGKHLTPSSSRRVDARARGRPARRRGGCATSKLANGDEPDFTFHA